MTEAKLITTVTKVVEAVLPSLETRLLDTVDRKVEAYRRAVWVRDNWCCKEMTTFASHFWCAPRPKRDQEWGTSLMIRGSVVNYCPFCGGEAGTEKNEHNRPTA